MKKYKYLKLKYIIPTVLFILVVVFLSIYLFGGLKKKVIKFSNDYFDNTLEGYIDYSEYEKTHELVSRVVAKNKKYVMVFDENTTIISVYANDDKFDIESLNTSTLLYSTAMKNGRGEQQANIIYTYIDENGKTGIINSFDKCVQYQNATTGTNERHYKVLYNEAENTVDVYYEIGDFAPFVFPKQYNYKDFEELFLGNAIFRIDGITDYEPVTIYDQDGNPVQVKKTDSKGSYDSDYGVCIKYRYLIVTDKEAAKYIIQNDLGLLQSKHSMTTEEAVSYIEGAKDSYFLFDELYDEDGKLKLQVGVNYNTADSPVHINPFTFMQLYNANFGSAYDFKVKIDNNGEEQEMNKLWPQDYNYISTSIDSFYKYEGSLSLLQKTALYHFLYVGNYSVNEEGRIVYDKHQYMVSLTDPSKLKFNYPVYFDYNNDGIYTEDEYFQYGGYPLKDEEGNYIYEYYEDGTIKNCWQGGFTTEQAIEQNDKYGNVDTTSKIVYTADLRFELTPNGLNVTLLHDSIDESRGQYSKLYTAEICKYFTYLQYGEGKAKAGEIIIPDGSGALIQFNSPKGEQYASKYPEKFIYGADGAITLRERGNKSENIMLGMYAFLETEDKKGVVVIADEGTAQNSINADIQRNNSTYNYCYYKTYLRLTEGVKITSTNTYIKSTNELFQGDIRFCYHFLQGDDLDYVDVANAYRKYLVDKYDIDENDETSSVNPTITFLGAYEKKTLKAGIVKEREFSITTFEEAMDIIRDLKGRGLNNLNVAYRSWTEDDNYQKTTTRVDVSDVLGDSKGLKKLSEYLKQNNISFFPEYFVSSGRGYDMMFGGLKYSSKSISGSYSNALSYVLSTGLENKEIRRGQFVSPIYYNSLITKYLKNYNRLGVSGIYINDIGNKNISDYSKSVQLYATGGSFEQAATLETIKNNGTKVMLRSPFDYAFKYADVATCVPVNSTLYGIVDYAIPLYQLVVNGLFDYSSDPINYNNDYSMTWNLLKAIETGSNPAFVLCAGDTNVLLDTNYTDYYNSYYLNWKDKIEYVVNTLENIGIYESRLVDHEFLTDNVVKVTYKNGLTIIINYDNENYYDSSNGLVVSSNWFAIIKGGK